MYKLTEQLHSSNTCLFQFTSHYHAHNSTMHTCATHTMGNRNVY